MMTPSFLAASVIALGLGAGPAFGQDATRSDAELQFTRLDADHDGFVTRADMSKVPELARRLAKFDADRDGKLNRAEFAALIAAMK
jgi:Ca2+-binding EF-hand superfamily protein